MLNASSFPPKDPPPIAEMEKRVEKLIVTGFASLRRVARGEVEYDLFDSRKGAPLYHKFRYDEKSHTLTIDAATGSEAESSSDACVPDSRATPKMAKTRNYRMELESIRATGACKIECLDASCIPVNKNRELSMEVTSMASVICGDLELSFLNLKMIGTSRLSSYGHIYVANFGCECIGSCEASKLVVTRRATVQLAGKCHLSMAISKDVILEESSPSSNDESLLTLGDDEDECGSGSPPGGPKKRKRPPVTRKIRSLALDAATGTERRLRLPKRPEGYTSEKPRADFLSCLLCGDRERCTVNVPCNHVLFCIECAEGLEQTTCAICKSELIAIDAIHIP